MSQENVDVVRALFAALDSQDWEAALGLFDPDVEWAPTEGRFHGVDGVVTSLAEWLEPWDEHYIEPEEFAEAGAEVLAVIHLTGRSERGSEMAIDQRFFQLYAVRDGKITRMLEFTRRDEALEAAGLSE
jgi:ketosteroid isomerase-like protein